MGGVGLAGLVRGWKAVSARKANLLLSRVGPFWMRGYFDRYIRSPEHLARAVAYVELNPVKAGLVPRPEDWPLSSASGVKPGDRAWSGASRGA
jgi:REP element-mobilizing transposase RayT